MSFLPNIDPARIALAGARIEEARRIRDAVLRERVVGVLGEAEVGKTQTVRQALAGAGQRTLYLDLRWAASEQHVGFLLAGQIAEAILPRTELRLLAERAGLPTTDAGLPTAAAGRSADAGLGPAAAGLPPSIESARARLSEILGGGLQEAMRAWPSGRYGWPEALESLEALCERQEVLLWLDHLEAPRLTFRHPLKVAPLLWSLSELVERCQGLRLLICGREGAGADALGARAAFHGRGLWLTMQAPCVAEWKAAARQLGVQAEIAAELARLTEGHPRTMLLALSKLAEQAGQTPGAGEKPIRSAAAKELLNELAAHDDGLASRTIEHARSLHRLGGQVLAQAALGQRPYASAQRGTTTTQDLSKALTRLRLAGLLRHERRWSVVNPLVALRLRAALRQSPSSERRPWS